MFFNSCDLLGFHERSSRTIIGILAFAFLLFNATTLKADTRVVIKLIAHYTHDTESGSEEWTFIVSASDYPDLDGRDKVTIISTVDGDSDPDFLSFRNIDDIVLFDYTYPDEPPERIYITQWGWENDRGDRKTYDCCGIGNDDDEVFEGGVWIRLACFDQNDSYRYDWPSMVGGDGRNHGLAIEVTITRTGVNSLRTAGLIDLLLNKGIISVNDLHKAVNRINTDDSNDE